MIKKFIISMLVFIIVAASSIEFTFARAGGGNSFRRSGSNSSSRSGSSFGTFVNVDLGCAQYIAISITSIIILIIIYSYIAFYTEKVKTARANFKNEKNENELKCLLEARVSTSMLPPNIVSNKVEKYKLTDSNFSRQAFLDFVTLLYTRYQDERGKKDFKFARFYMAPKLLNQILSVSSNNIKIDNIIIGAYKITVLDQTESDQIIVRFESYYDKTEKLSEEVKTNSFYAVEFWSFIRSSGKISPEPTRLSRLSCPSCGSTQEPTADGECNYCHQVPGTGDFYWLVEEITIQSVKIKPPIKPPKKSGKNMPTIYQSNIQEKESELKTSDPDFSMDKFKSYVEKVFMKVQEGWSKKKPELLRPYETDNLYNMHAYLINTYIAERKTNVRADIQITNIEVCRVELDAFYQTITMRIFAKMKNYTKEDERQILDGSDNIISSFSEYWTFMRKSAIKTRELSTDECPNCSATLDINASGICAYCGSKINSGDFAWVLSMIEQDEIYNG